jgi:hypothetical protein
VKQSLERLARIGRSLVRFFNLAVVRAMMEDEQAIRAVVELRTRASQRGDAALAISRRRYDEGARRRFFHLA